MKLSTKSSNGKKMPYQTADVDFCVKAADVSDDGVFEGLASPFFGEPDGAGDIVISGAYKDTLLIGGRNGNGIAMLYQHQYDKPIGVWERMEEIEDGLYVRGRLNLEVQLARETYSLMKMGALKGLSIGFELPKLPNGDIDPDSYERVYDKKNDRWVTYLKKINLWEVSVVTFPCATNAVISDVKSLHECKTEREFENALRDSGLSKSKAQYVVSLIKPALRDSDGGNGKSMESETQANGMAELLMRLQSRNKEDVQGKAGTNTDEDVASKLLNALRQRKTAL